jgi:hypothetical protein
LHMKASDSSKIQVLIYFEKGGYVKVWKI